MTTPHADDDRRLRLPRYKRATTPPPMQITDRDVAVLDAVCDMRFLTSDQIQLLLFGPSTASSCRRRLSLLFHNAYLDRMLVPTKNAFGSTTAVYILSRKGADFVARATGREIADLDWRPDELDRELYFIKHSLAINDFRIMLTNASKGLHISVDWIGERTLRRREMKDYVADPDHPGRGLAIVPDGYFRLSRGDDSTALALEIDRGTVEEKPFKRKVIAYGRWKTSGAYEKRYRTNSLRILWVVADLTRDPNRLGRIKRWTEAVGGRSLFWFAHLHELRAGPLTEPLWRKAADEGLYPLLR